MNKIMGLIALTMVSTSASAIQLDFSGNFNSGTGTIAASTPFSGSFNFDLEHPNLTETGGTVSNEKLYLSYWTNASGFATTDAGVVNSGNLELDFNNDNVVTQQLIDAHGFSSIVFPNTYDFVSLSADSNNAQFSGENNDLFDGVEFSIIATYDKATFEQPGFDYNAIMTYTPVFLGFEIQRMNQGVEVYHGAGELTELSVSAVPVPAAFWLFGSALAGLAIRTRRRF